MSHIKLIQAYNKFLLFELFFLAGTTRLTKIG